MSTECIETCDRCGKTGDPGEDLTQQLTLPRVPLGTQWRPPEYIDLCNDCLRDVNQVVKTRVTRKVEV